MQGWVVHDAEVGVTFDSVWRTCLSSLTGFFTIFMVEDFFLDRSVPVLRIVLSGGALFGGASLCVLAMGVGAVWCGPARPTVDLHPVSASQCVPVRPSECVTVHPVSASSECVPVRPSASHNCCQLLSVSTTCAIFYNILRYVYGKNTTGARHPLKQEMRV